ncbi:hypothetical protein J1N35_023715 [Gossypium stocksii]|uniref:NB-ARC domain-containing protein n=1 Tax=Gossypium stocksii TaxID=47602 RepID=A0A9D3VK08_9ROSI|nr:hypothetical protein J1N35_023715 [Gossypium stocksii]
MAKLVGPSLDVFKFIGRKLVDESTQAMKEVHAEGHFPMSLIVNDPSTIAVSLPTTELIGAANVREEIYQYLMGDDVGIIGVLGYSKAIEEHSKSIGKKNLSDDEDTIIHAGKVSKMLRRQERHVLILDDVWERFSLEDVGILKPTLENGYKLVLTTCSESIIRSIEFKKVRVPCLPIEEAINLFLSKVGRDMLSNPTLESFMKLVVRECDGLPLAIVTLASCMRGVIDPHVWENTIDELRGYIRNIHNMKDKVHECLKFSYEHLKQRDREFFCIVHYILKIIKLEKMS